MYMYINKYLSVEEYVYIYIYIHTYISGICIYTCFGKILDLQFNVEISKLIENRLRGRLRRRDG